MGIPKFFRYISERYPLILQRLDGSDIIPEFDNFYVDCNHILHTCARTSDAQTGPGPDKSSLLTEDRIFTSVFAYLDHIFRKVKPKELFFIAVDGVTPRAKMNQQRARRFRAADDREKAQLSEDVFDGNCITPGTLFMSHLSDHLQYFINRKITEDPTWQGIRVILSGHEIPGEGEHKIMEYIRHSRAQPGYNPSTRHCLYGLDADLIMLGLVTHEPHFCLLREEVVFSPSFGRKKNTRLDSLKFNFLHLSLMREYLDLEFKELEHKLNFKYDPERIIGDFVLIGVFVGNDFLPHLPDLHISKHGLELLFDIYKKVLPVLDGFINNNGVIDMSRMSVIIDEIARWEVSLFDVRHPHSKAMKQSEGSVSLRVSYGKRYEQEEVDDGDDGDDGDGDVPPVSDWEYSTDSDEEVTAQLEELRIRSVVEVEHKYENTISEWKRQYYRSKFNISYNDQKAMDDLTKNYLEGIQWVMHYYYTGVISWRWYYRYHYAPRVSDLCYVSNMEFTFTLGEPFKPFEQLLAVLPVASRTLIPEAYHSLMCSPDSPILDFWPEKFEKDLNGKDNDWEAVVKIPFFDEPRLLKAMAARESRLTQEERVRNNWGKAKQFAYTPYKSILYPSPSPSHLNIYHCQCRTEPFELPSLVGLRPVIGLCDEVLLGKAALFGLPTFKSLPHSSMLETLGVNIHWKQSCNKSIAVQIQHPYSNASTEEIAKKMIGRRVFMSWPLLREGFVVGVSDRNFKWEAAKLRPRHGALLSLVSVRHETLTRQNLQWQNTADRIAQSCLRKGRLMIGDVKILLHVHPMKGIKRSDDGWLKEYDTKTELEQPLQLCLDTGVTEDPRFLERQVPSVEEEFPQGSLVFYLGIDNYGAEGRVVKAGLEHQTLFAAPEGRVARTVSEYPTLTITFSSPSSSLESFKQITNKESAQSLYKSSIQVASIIGISLKAVSKITSSFMVLTGEGKLKLGLSLKFDSKALKVIGYTKKVGPHWYYTDKSIDLLREYKKEFPEVFYCLDHTGNNMIEASTIFKGYNPNERTSQIRQWLKSKGIPDLISVPLDYEQLGKDTVAELETYVDSLANERLSPLPTRPRTSTGISTKEVLKPADAIYHLQNQKFTLGDRVKMVSDSGLAPLSAKGTVIGVSYDSIDVLWDAPFISGVTLDDRCSAYRGAPVGLNTCLNLTNPQFKRLSSSSSNAWAPSKYSAIHQFPPNTSPPRSPPSPRFPIPTSMGTFRTIQPGAAPSPISTTLQFSNQRTSLNQPTANLAVDEGWTTVGASASSSNWREARNTRGSSVRGNGNVTRAAAPPRGNHRGSFSALGQGW